MTTTTGNHCKTAILEAANRTVAAAADLTAAEALASHLDQLNMADGTVGDHVAQVRKAVAGLVEAARQEQDRARSRFTTLLLDLQVAAPRTFAREGE